MSFPKLRPSAPRFAVSLVKGQRRWFLGLLFISWIFSLLSPPPAAANPLAAEVGEYELKAVYLYNFLHFVYWPPVAGPGEPAAVQIGVVGDSPFGTALVELQEKVRQSGRGELAIVEYGPYREGLDLRHNQLLFVCASESRHFQEIVAGVKGSAVLTVADAAGFLAVGGMISLITTPQGKIGWQINRGALQQAGLQPSAKLLQIAQLVVADDAAAPQAGGQR